MSALRSIQWWSACLLVSLAACGGDGGGGEASGETSFTLSGTLALPETAAVDSDTNDPFQAGRAPNDTTAAAQVLVTPVQLIGNVNEPGTGSADGANFQTGDVLDVYQVDLKAGQVIELEFTANPAVNDLDLFVLSEGSQVTDPPIGASIGANAYECVAIQRPGKHQVVVAALSGASLYTMRIGAPNDGSSCANVVSGGAGIVPNEVVALPSGDAAKAARGGALAGTAATAAQGPTVLRLPADAVARSAALDRVATAAAPAGTKRVAAATAAATASGLPPALQAVLDTVRYAKLLQATGFYQYAEPNFTMRLAKADVGPYPPADRLYPYQRWHHEMVNMPAAMSTLVPLQGQLSAFRPLVAVVDSGIVANHPDFAGQIETQASFTGGNAFTLSADDPSSAGSPTGFHGTHVAGTIAAATFDTAGVAGIAPMARLLPIRVFAKDSSTSNSADVAQAILYAAGLPNRSGTAPSRRADVINLSLGSTRACPAAYADAVTRARAAGVIVVAASGNESLAARDTPSNCPGVFSVGALDAQRARAPYSNRDPLLSLAAPGGDSTKSTTGTGLPDEVFSTLGDFSGGARVPSYGGMSGTSMATPHVAGVMALMRYANPAISVDQVQALLDAGRITDDLGAAGRDAATGWGVVNASKAVNEALALAGTNPTPIAGAVVAQPSAIDFGAVRTSIDLQVSVQGGASSEGLASIASNLPAVTIAPQSVDGAKLGTYTVTVDRGALPVGSSFGVLTLTTTTNRVIEVSVSVLKAAPGATAAADYGRVYVLLLDPDTGDPLHQTSANVTAGTYHWQIAGVTASRVQVIAGTDIDNDSLLCQKGEACGGYPQYGTALSVLELTGSRSGIDFELSPFGGVSTGRDASLGVRRHR